MHRAYEKMRREWVDAGRLRWVSHFLWHAAHTYPLKQALIAPERTLSYDELLFYTLKVAEWLSMRGVKPGDRVVILISNSIDFYCAYLAAWHIGAVAVPLNTYLHAREVVFIMEEAEPAVVLTTAPTAAIMAEISAAVVPMENRLLVDGYLWHLPYAVGGGQVMAQSLLPVVRAATETAVILYTSGSTGVPKGVVLSGKNVVTNALQARTLFAQVLGDGYSERFLAILPLFHAFSQNASVWLPLMMGATIIIVPRIDRRALLAGLEQKPTIFFGFPALFGLLVMMRTAPVHSIKLFVSGADALPDKIRMAFSLTYGRKICSGYGLTEASPVVAVDIFGQDHATNTVGQPVPGLSCRLLDDAGHEVNPGIVGTLWISGDNIMQGYYRSPELTAQVLQDGWLNTGDLATRSENGLITIVGRCKDLIINKGFNIYPQEVENVLLRHPAVFKAAVIARDEEGDQVPVAYVAVREGVEVQPADLAAFCRDNLAAYKVPRVVTCVTDLPMTATGKIDKGKLRRDGV